MSDRFSYEPVVLMQPSGMTDGAVRYRSVAAWALAVREDDTLSGMPQGTALRMVLLLKSPVPPIAGARIRRNGGLLQISSVRTCRDPDGTVCGYRCEMMSV